MFHRLLAAYFGFFVVFWFIGIDQFFFAAFCLVGLMSYLMSEQRTQSIEILLFAAFILATFVSATQITSGFRYVSYLRNEGVYVAMFFILLSSSFASSNKAGATDRIYLVLLVFAFQCTLIGFLASIGIGLAFKSPAASFLPDLGSRYLFEMLNKSTIQAEALWFSEGFMRPRGLMLYSNTMAGVLCSSMAIKAYFGMKFWSEQRRFIALVCFGAIIMDSFAVYSSLSRSTWLGFAFALTVFPFVFKTSFPAKLIPGAIALLAAGLLFASGLNEGIESRLTDKGHSNEGRGLNYLLIWEMTTSSADKLLIGHGTQLDHPELTIPVGSHSTYLGIFFKFGLFGMTSFTLFLFFLYRRMLAMTRNVHALNAQGMNFIRPYFLCFGLTVLLVQMLFIEVDVDASYALYVAALMYLVLKESDAIRHALRIGAPDRPAAE